MGLNGADCLESTRRRRHGRACKLWTKCFPVYVSTAHYLLA
jgi:hypothetical protein